MSESKRIALVEIDENGIIKVNDWINDIHDELEIKQGFEEEYENIYQFLHLFGTKTYENYLDETIIVGTDETRAKIIKHEKEESEVDTFETYQAIIEGRCYNCGSNRLEYGYKEPAGVTYVECPICGKEDVDFQNDEWNYTIGD